MVLFQHHLLKELQDLVLVGVAIYAPQLSMLQSTTSLTNSLSCKYALQRAEADDSVAEAVSCEFCPPLLLFMHADGILMKQLYQLQPACSSMTKVQ